MFDEKKADFLAEWQRLIEAEREALIHYERAKAAGAAGDRFDHLRQDISILLAQLDDVRKNISVFIAKAQACRRNHTNALIAGTVMATPLLRTTASDILPALVH